MLADNLKKFRKQAGLRQEDIARVLGLDRSAYSYYETGRAEPSITNIKIIAKMLCVDFNALLGYETPVGVVELNNDQQAGYQPQSAEEYDIAKFTADEKLLLAYYRASEDKKRIIDTVKSLYEAEIVE